MKILINLFIISICFSASIHAQQKQGVRAQMIAFEDNLLNQNTDFNSVTLINQYREAAAITKGKMQELRKEHIKDNYRLNGKVVSLQEYLSANEDWSEISNNSKRLMKEKEERLKMTYPEYNALFQKYAQQLDKRRNISRSRGRRN